LVELRTQALDLPVERDHCRMFRRERERDLLALLAELVQLRLDGHDGLQDGLGL
jgi:hypothetical protein